MISKVDSDLRMERAKLEVSRIELRMLLTKSRSECLEKRLALSRLKLQYLELKETSRQDNSNEVEIRSKFRDVSFHSDRVTVLRSLREKNKKFMAARGFHIRKKHVDMPITPCDDFVEDECVDAREVVETTSE